MDDISPNEGTPCRAGLVVRRVHMGGVEMNGLFTLHDIPKGAFVGMYIGKFTPLPVNKDGEPRSSTTRNHYVYETDEWRITPKVKKDKTADPRIYPCAMANEPMDGEHANVYFRKWHSSIELGLPGPRRKVTAVSLQACAPIPAGKQLLLHYGKAYEVVRKILQYTAGLPCIARPKAAVCETPAAYAGSQAVPFNQVQGDGDPPHSARATFALSGI